MTITDREISQDCGSWMPDQLAGRSSMANESDLACALEQLASSSEMQAEGAALNPGAGERRWKSLWHDDFVDVWLIAWGEGTDTGWHDHDISSGGFGVVAGQVVESRPSFTGAHSQSLFSAGQARGFGPEYLHRVQAYEGAAVTVHAYSPPLRGMGQYEAGTDGVTTRRLVAAEEELRG